MVTRLCLTKDERIFSCGCTTGDVDCNNIYKVWHLNHEFTPCSSWWYETRRNLLARISSYAEDMLCISRGDRFFWNTIDWWDPQTPATPFWFLAASSPTIEKMLWNVDDRCDVELELD